MRESLEELFPPNTSPYLNMYRAGLMGYTLDEVLSRLTSIGIVARDKDIANWHNGNFKCSLRGRTLDFMQVPTRTQDEDFFQMKLSDYPKFPPNWMGCRNRFFPCNYEGKPMQRWGYKPGQELPALYDLASAKALSETGLVGQNMCYQPFIVLDIDGVGHGTCDTEVISFGNQFKFQTLTMEDPNKKGSYHLYFKTDRIIQLRHFPYAKLDLMGNNTNAAVYLKHKLPNGLPMAELTQQVWDKLIYYLRSRKEQAL